MHVLCGEGGVVHEEKVNIGDVVDNESLVAGGHHVAGLPVGAVSDLSRVSAPIAFPNLVPIHHSLA